MDITNFSYQLPDKRQLFQDLSISFVPGQINILLGVNGVGKSTLLDFIAGVSPNKQAAAFHDFPPMQQVAYQMQGVPVTGATTVLQTLQMMLELDDPSLSVTAADLPATLQPIAHTKFRHLSGGQRRLVMLEGVCHLQRQLYLFDEPESGLDVKVAAQVMHQICQLPAAGKTVILTTHQFENLPVDQTHIALLANQRCVFSGSPQELMALNQTTSLQAAYLQADM